MLSITTIAPDPLLYSSISGHNGNIRVPEVTSGFKVDGGFRLFFDEIVAAGNGDIVISNGVDTRIIDISDTTQITFDEIQYWDLARHSIVIINPTDDLVVNATYSVQMASGVLVDATDHAYAGISDETAFNFTTVEPIITETGIEEPSFWPF